MMKSLVRIVAVAALLGAIGAPAVWANSAVVKPSAKGASKTEVSTPVLRFCSPAKFRLAIDIGHTPKVPGSISARGVGEYDFNKRLAKELFEALRKAGFARAFLINPSGRHIRNGDRIREARRKSADLFLSIHHDSVRRSQLKKWNYKGEELEYTHVARGHSVHISRRGPEVKKSLAAARLLGNALRGLGLRPTDHHAKRNVGANLKHIDPYAGVYNHPNIAVIWLSKMPAVLFEAAVIKNPKDEQRANTLAYRKKLIEGVLAMAKGFCGKPKSLFR